MEICSNTVPFIKIHAMATVMWHPFCSIHLCSCNPMYPTCRKSCVHPFIMLVMYIPFLGAALLEDYVHPCGKTQVAEPKTKRLPAFRTCEHARIRDCLP
jgi:hypothetical protein